MIIAPVLLFYYLRYTVECHPPSYIPRNSKHGSMKSYFILLFTLALISCKKDDPEKQARVTYKVIETSSATPSYTVTYSGESNATRTEGPITADSWTSSTITDKERGDFVSFTVESTSGSGSFKMQIFMNSVLWQEDHVDIPYTPKTISGNLPE